MPKKFSIYVIQINILFCFLKDFIYLFLERGREGERERERETLMCGCLLCAPYWGSGP